MKRIHIVGIGPRTGTTLMAEAMIACFDIDQYTDHEDRVFVVPPDEGNIFLTKDPRDTLVINPLLYVNPDLYIICMIRDPRDVIVSKHELDPDRYWAGLRFWKTYIPFWRRLRKHPRFITVKYEDLVSDPDRVQQRLVEKMPFLTIKRPFTQYHEVAKPSIDSMKALKEVRPIAPTGVGNWRNHLARIAGQLQLHGPIAGDLIEFGYEKDDLWINMLEGVEPDLSESHWPEYITKKDFRKRQRGKYKEVIKYLMRKLMKFGTPTH